MLGGMQRTLSGLILKFAHQYLEQIDSDLNLSLWGGDVVLKRVQLRLDVLQKIIGYDNNLSLDHAIIGELRIHIPWTSITTSNIEITLANLEIGLRIDRELAKPSNEGELNSANNINQTQTLGSENPSNPTSETQNSSSWTKSLLDRIIANIAININGLSITLSNPASGSLHISLNSLKFRSTNSDWETAQVDPPSAPWKLMNYLISISLLNISVHELKGSGNNMQPSEKLLRDLDLQIRIRVYQSPFVRYMRRNTLSLPVAKAGPRLQIDILFQSPTEMSLSAEQLLFLSDLNSSIRSGSSKSTTIAVSLVETPLVAVPRTSESMHRSSWGSWAWDFIASPPDDTVVIDISESRPADVVVITLDAPSIIVHFCSVGFIFAALHISSLRISLLKSALSMRFSFSLLSAKFINQTTLLPFLIIAADSDAKEFMPFMEFDGQSLESCTNSVSENNLQSDYTNRENSPTKHLASLSLQLETTDQEQCFGVFIDTFSLLLNLKSSSSVLLFREFARFIPTKKASQKKKDVTATSSAQRKADISLNRFFITLHIEDMAEWKQDELCSGFNALSFQISGFLFKYDESEKVYSHFDSSWLKYLEIRLQRHRYVEVGHKVTAPSGFSLDNFVLEYFPRSGAYSFSSKSLVISLSLDFFYISILAGACIAGLLEQFSYADGLRTKIADLRPSRLVCLFDAMLLNATLSLRLADSRSAGIVPFVHDTLLTNADVHVYRRGQERRLVSAGTSPFLSVQVSPERDISVSISPVKVIWDSVFCDVVTMLINFKKQFISVFATGSKRARGENSKAKLDPVRFKPSSLTVNSAPVVLLMPLQDAFHIRRIPSLSGYRSSPSLMFRLPSITISPLALTLGDFSVTDSNGSILLDPLSVHVSVRETFSSVNVEITRLIFTIDVHQAVAMKLAIAALTT